jgi:HEAT repeat protein
LIQRQEQSIRNLPIDEKQLLQSSLSELQSSDKAARRKAAKVLGQLKHVSTIQPLCETLKDEDTIVRTVAAEALGLIGGNLAVLPLIEVLENDSHAHARAASAKALGLIGDKRAVEAIVQGLKDKSGHVRKWCWNSVSKLR